MSGILASAPVGAVAGINQQINFQGRLYNAAGATVPDGFYNIEFKIYCDGDGVVGGVGGDPGSCNGDADDEHLLWTESHLNNNTQGVRVVNGFMSVQLGSITAFGSSVNWNWDELYLTMNIGNTNGTCTPFSNCAGDGEMSPMKRMTATPYALNSNQLGGLTSGNFVQLAQGVQTDNTTNSSISINKTNTGNILTLQSGGVNAFSVTNAGDINFGSNADHNISVAAATSGNHGNSLTVSAGNGTGTDRNGGNLVLQGGSSTGTGTPGSVIVKPQTDSTAAFIAQNAAGTTTTLAVDTTNNRVGIGAGTPSATLHVTSNAAAPLFRVTDSTATSKDVLNIADGGAITLRNQTDSTAALQVQNSAGTSNLLTADTTNDRVILGSSTDLESNGGSINSPYGGIGQYNNLLSKSEEFNHADWTKTGATVPATNITAPNGQATADSLLSDSNGESVSQTTSTAPTNDNYTFSVWLKTASGTQNADLRIDGATTGTGTARTVTATTTWQRFSVTQNTNGFTGNIMPVIFPGGTGGQGTVHAWGAQLVKSPTPQVYTYTGNEAHDNARYGMVTDGRLTSLGSSAGLTLQAQDTTDNYYTLYSAAGELTFYGGLNIRAALTVDGRLGLGTNNDTPEARLHVEYDGADELFQLTDTTAGGVGSRNVFTVADEGAVTLQNRTNSAAAFQVQKSTGSDVLFTADTTNNRVSIGNATASAGTDTTLLVLDSAATGNAPSGVNGGMFYDATLNKFRCHQNGGWTDCISTAGATTLQGAYDGGTAGDQVVQLDSTQDSLIFRNPAASGTDSTYIMTIDQLNTSATGCGGDVCGGLDIQSAGTGNLLRVRDTTATAVDVLTIADTGVTTFRPQTNSATAFQVQNSSGASHLTIDTISSNINLLGNNTATLSTWNTTTAMSIGASTPRVRGSAVAANGYLYHIGGVNGSGTTVDTVQYAKISADGTIGTWASTTVLPEARRQFQTVTLNGYIYVIGGRDASGNVEATSFYAKLNNDGTVGTWNSTTALTAGGGAAKFAGATVAYNGTIYYIGGLNSGFSALSTVYYAKANPDGTLASSWTLSGSGLPTGIGGINNSATIANGYIYITGGYDSGPLDEIFYAKIGSDGVPGTWTTVTDALNSTGGGDEGMLAFVANGYLYAVGGDYSDRTAAFQLNADGSIGSGAQLADTGLTTNGEAGGAQANGYFYLLGGSSGSDGGGTARNTVYYASVPRVKVGGSLDLVGYGGENLNEGRTGGTLTAGSTKVLGTLDVSDEAVFLNNISVNGDLSVGGKVAFKNTSNATNAFQVQNATGTALFNVDTSTTTLTVGSSTLATGTETINIGTNNTAGSTTNVTIGAGGSATGGTTTLQAKGNITMNTNGTVRATFDTANGIYFGNGVTAAAPNNFTISGTGSSTTAVAGGNLTVQGGNATVGNANGGNLILTGGTGIGTGVKGLTVLDTPAFTTATAQNFTADAAITAANVNSSGAILLTSNQAGWTATLNDPAITTAGKILYVTNSGSFDMTLAVNGGGAGNLIALKPNTSATMVWNGSDWTAAGASSSTDLQSAYNNTLTSAGGAELVLNPTGGNADGLTVRNNATTPIIGGILEAQTSVGSNLFSVNNNATEYATNGGAETAGASASAFPSNTWDTTTGGTVDRYTTAGDNIATGQASVRVQTTTTNHGARNRISSSLTSSLEYTVSLAVRSAANFKTLQVLYSPDGTTSGTTQCATTQTVTEGQWSRITCTFTASGSITSSNSMLIRQTDGTARTFYIDNLSINVNASATYVADGSVDAALGSNWTAFGSLDALVRDTSIIYDTSGSVNVDTPNNADRGVINNLGVTPAPNTQYLVTFFARSSNAFNDIRVRYSRDGGTNFVSCVDYNTQTVSISSFTEITCLFTTDGTTATNPDLIIDQPTASDRDFWVDALTVTLNTNRANNIQIGAANKGGPTTLFTLDRSNVAPIAANNESYLGSMYYDTSTGRIQCYEADGWGACGAQPDNIVNLNPEYSGAVLNGSGTGTMTADFCSDDTALTVNASLCETGEAKNFYRWTSPQASQQTYSIYVTYQLPSTFKGFASDDTVQLTARTSSTVNAAVTYEMFKSTGSAVTKCGTGETTVVTTVDTWQTVGINGNEATGCAFTAASAGNFIIFKINVKANSSANAYVGTLSFTTTGR